MEFQLTCTVHNAPMIPADKIEVVGQPDAEGFFVVDESNLYCTGGTGDHAHAVK